MTNRYLAQDVRNQIITILDDSSSGFNAMISTINTERTHTAPTANDITYKWGMNQFPFLLVDVDESEVIYDDEATPISLNYTILPEVYTVFIMGFLRYSDDNIYNWCEDWIEAIIRVCHNYNDSNISWLAYTRTERTEINKNENETLKTFLVEFEARVN
jgi:hypothetical protein